MMTRKAQALGMSNTRFRNASGLPEAGQMSTARDLALLGRRIAYDFPQYYHYFALPSFSYAGRTYGTHDNLLDQFEGTDGIKTGYTRMSGFNLVTSVVRGNHHVVGVVMGGRTAHERDSQMMWMLGQILDQAATSRIQLAHASVPWRGGSGPKSRPFDRPAAPAAPVVVAAATPPPVPTPSPQQSGQLPPIVVMQTLPQRHPAEDDRIAQLIATLDDDEDRAERVTAAPPRRAPVPVANPRQAIQLARAPEAAAQAPTTRPTPKPATPVRLASLERSAREQIEEGDIGDSAPPRVATRPAVAVIPKPSAPLPKPQIADGPRRWTVQIGAFANQGEAQTRLAIYAERSMDVVGQARRIVVPFNGADGTKLYRARFGNFAESEAREVCRRMTQRGQTCFATASP
jgi:D-alanyl-D-alanine carboxypeptidase